MAQLGELGHAPSHPLARTSQPAVASNVGGDDWGKRRQRVWHPRRGEPFFDGGEAPHPPLTLPLGNGKRAGGPPYPIGEGGGGQRRHWGWQGVAGGTSHAPRGRGGGGGHAPGGGRAFFNKMTGGKRRQSVWHPRRGEPFFYGRKAPSHPLSFAFGRGGGSFFQQRRGSLTPPEPSHSGL